MSQSAEYTQYLEELEEQCKVTSEALQDTVSTQGFVKSHGFEEILIPFIDKRIAELGAHMVSTPTANALDAIHRELYALNYIKSLSSKVIPEQCTRLKMEHERLLAEYRDISEGPMQEASNTDYDDLNVLLGDQ